MEQSVDVGGVSHQPRTERSHARAHEALRSGDLPGVGSYFADDVAWEAPDTLPTGGVIHGRDAVLEQSGGTMGRQAGIVLYVLALVTVWSFCASLSTSSRRP